jgi:hypothetical protein
MDFESAETVEVEQIRLTFGPWHDESFPTPTGGEGRSIFDYYATSSFSADAVHVDFGSQFAAPALRKLP